MLHWSTPTLVPVLGPFARRWVRPVTLAPWVPVGKGPGASPRMMSEGAGEVSIRPMTVEGGSRDEIGRKIGAMEVEAL
jgi:hypothetical protein